MRNLNLKASFELQTAPFFCRKKTKLLCQLEKIKLVDSNDGMKMDELKPKIKSCGTVLLLNRGPILDVIIIMNARFVEFLN